MAINFPNNPSNGQLFSLGAASWRWNGYAWMRIPDPGAKGEVGSKGDKGGQGLIGDPGQKGNKGEPSTVKGEKGQKGIQGDEGQQGTSGFKGEKGNDNSTKGEKGSKGDSGGGGGGASVTIGVNPPTSPAPNQGDLWWDSDDSDLHVYYDDGDSQQWVSVTASLLKGEKGSQGDKGQKGERGEKGEKGQDGFKGQKGEIGPEGGDGGVGEKGNQGNQGFKGDKGEDNSTKGQKGEKGQQGVSTKGEKGAEGADNSTKGQKGDDNSTKGQKGQKGIQGDDNSTKGQKGDDNSTKGSQGDKGDKGSEGAAGSTGIPIGTIVAFGGSSAPSGWLLCNGQSTSSYTSLRSVVGNNVPDLRDRFIIGAGSSYNLDDTGGASTKQLGTANLPSHTHTSGTLAVSNRSLTGDIQKISECYNVAGSASGVFSKKGTGNSPVTGSLSNSPTAGVDFDASHDHGISGNTGDQGGAMGQAFDNKPPYWALTYIIKH
tara:strand:+ start:2095 stop:3549 length:1455 start_codon:yes stop_codon:yes gene_type:complete